MTDFFNPWKAQKPDDSFWKATNTRLNPGAYQQRRHAMTDKKDFINPDTVKPRFNSSSADKLPPLPQEPKPIIPQPAPFASLPWITSWRL